MHCLHKSGKICTQFHEKTAIHFVMLDAIYIQEACTQFDEKPVVHLPQEEGSVGRKTTMHFGSLVWTPNPMSN